MRRFHPLLLPLWLACAGSAAAGTPAQRPRPVPIHASKIVLVGDSTTAVQSGWGPEFCARHVTASLSCVNLARGGRSSYSYRAEGSWDIALAEMRTSGYANTWVLLQFGHNDQPGKPERSTDLEHEFPDNLRRYISDIRAAGARPVLLTPLTRRQFDNEQLLDDLAPWAEAIRRVANELQVPLVDLHARSRAVVQAMGPVAAMQLAQRPAGQAQVVAALDGTTVDAEIGVAGSAQPETGIATAKPMAQAKAAFDYTHLGPQGAALFATLVSTELAKADPALRPLLLP